MGITVSHMDNANRLHAGGSVMRKASSVNSRISASLSNQHIPRQESGNNNRC